MTTTTELPEVQTVIDRWAMAKQADPNPTPRPGNRAIHTTALRVWIGHRSTVDGGYADDGYDWMALAAESGWKAAARYGDWPMVVEAIRSFPDVRPTRFFRFTYLEGSVYLAEYQTMGQLVNDLWRSDG